MSDADDIDLDADRHDCCHGVEGPCPICDSELFDDCDHGYGTDETPWRFMFCGGEVVREYPGEILCKRCWRRIGESPRPVDLSARKLP